MSPSEIPASLADLLDRPLYGTLAIVGTRSDAQSSPMWFEVIDGTIRFTHTRKRAKFRALQKNPSMSLAVFDPDQQTHYVEVRGRLVQTIDDPTGAFFQRLAHRYGNANAAAPADAADRVILVMSIDRVLGQ